MASGTGRLRLFGEYGNPDFLKVLITLYTSEVDLSSIEILYSAGDVSQMTGNKLALMLSPTQSLTDVNEICQYFLLNSPKGNVHLSPSCSEWIEWEKAELKEVVSRSFMSAKIDSDLQSALRKVTGKLKEGNNCLTNDIKASYGLVDILVWSTLYPVFAKESFLYEGLNSSYPVVANWFERLSKNEFFAKAVQDGSNLQGYATFHAFMHKATEGPWSTHLVTDEEIRQAVDVWLKGPAVAPKPKERIHPILPVQGEKNVLITSALPYVNNVPHLGNIIGCVLSGDVLSRYCRLRNYQTLYICGTDEYGTATETRAMQEGITPQELCTKYNAIQQEVYQWFNIDFDYFGRTSTPQQTEITQDIFWRLYKRGFITEKTVEQHYCEGCKRFLADRFVEGICPICSYEDCRGDQCDQCGKLINAIELKSPRCKTCSKTPHVKSSDHLFIDLSKLASDVDEWSQKSMREGNWSANSRTITSAWLRDGIKPRSITRDLKWGTPVPLEGFTDKVFYVWFDAPIGYLSITACYTKEWEKWWKNPDQVTLHQFMAKDNVPFHTVVFPATLIGANDNYTLLNVMAATEYLNYEDGKFSKSRGVGVFGDNAKESGISADIFRFYLLYVRPETQDTAFSWHDLMLKNNTELLNNLGNFINRTLVFVKKYFDSTIPAMDLNEDDMKIVALVAKELRTYNDTLEAVRLRDGLKNVLNISRLGNGHIQGAQPWSLVKGSPEEKSRAGSLFGLCANITCLLSVMLQPYMPSVSKQIQEQLQAPPESNILSDHFHPFIQPGHRIGEVTPLFSKIEPETAQLLRQKYQGQQVPSSN